MRRCGFGCCWPRLGQITESDVQLAKASQRGDRGVQRACDERRRGSWQRGTAVDIRYYSIIYDVADDVEKLVRGKVAPKAREKFLGYAEIRKVFDITKTGKVAGCMITEGPGASAVAACGCCGKAW